VQTDVFVTGGTGYMGQRLTAALLSRGHRVRALARKSSAERIPSGAVPVIGDALDAKSFTSSLRPGDTLVHLVGTPHPSPRKAAEFKRVDLASILASVDAGRHARIAHLVYVSVAQPAPVMHAYVAARAAGEAAIVGSGIPATILRPWYVVGPGHRWALALLPLYGIARLLRATREGAQRLGLVTLEQMIDSLSGAVESPPESGVRYMNVPDIRRAQRLSSR
jgi:uncharacterized protein YbjT (DUF2867 family)